MKLILCTLIAALLLGCPAMALTPTLSPTPTLLIEMFTPEPTETPAGEEFSSEDLIVTLPYGLDILRGDTLAAYEAAVQSNYPGAARTILAAINADATAAVSYALIESDAAAADAAREAAEEILGSSATVTEKQYGENNCAGFSCAIGDQTYRLYYFSNGSSLLCAGIYGLAEADIADMFTGLIF